METREIKKEVKFLATDYDGCAVTLHGTRSDLLSTSLIQHALNGGYTGFYGCTHRCYGTAWLVKKLSSFKAIYSNYKKEVIENNITTYKVTTNFAKIASLPCMAVSMLDDSLSACGFTYENMIKPYETMGKSAKRPYISACKIPTYYGSKNNQLIQIAKHAVEHYPTSSITIDFVDDHDYLCYEAVNAIKNPAWPKQVHLNVYHHYASSDHAKMTLIYQQKTGYLAEKKSSATLCQRTGLFAVAMLSTSVLVGVTKRYCFS